MTTTRKKLSLAFGTLTALLLLLGGVLLAQVRAIQNNVRRQMDVSSPRAAAVREMETHVVSFALDVQSFLHTGDPVFREDATQKATQVEKFLADYERVAAKDTQREMMVARFSASWREYRQFATALMDAPNSQPPREVMARLVTDRMTLEKILKEEMKPEAVATFSNRLTETSDALNRAGALTLFMIVAGTLFAIATSVAASYAVLRSENKLRASADRLRLVTDGAPALISYIDAQFHYRNVNKLWAEWFARSESTVEGRPVREVLGEKAWLVVQPMMARALAGESVTFERELRYRDDGLRWLQTTYAPDRDEAGSVRGFVAHATDISQRKQAELELQQAHEKLQESEARFRALFESAPVGIAQGDVTTMEFLSANQRYCDIIGYTRDDLRTLNFKQFTHPDDLQADLDNMARLLAGECRQYTMEKRFIRKDGSVVWGSLTVAALWEPGEKPVHYMAVLADITARKQAEQALQQAHAELEHRVAERTAELLTTNWKLSNEVNERKQAEVALRNSEHRFRSIYANAPTGIAITGMDGRFIQCNPSYSQIIGYSEKELCAINFSSLIHPEDKAENLTYVRRLLDDEIASFGMENRYVRKNGDVVWVHKFVSSLQDEQGRSTHIIALVTDITERKLADMALRESEERFRQVTEAIAQVFWMTDVDKNKMLYVSPGYERIWGRTCQSLLDSPRDWLEAVHPADRERIRDATLTRQATCEYDLEFRIHRPDGEERWIHDRAFPIHNAAGEVHRIAGIADDITERKRLQDEIEGASQRERERLGRDLHDGLSQLLVGARLKTDSLVKKLADQSPENVPRAKAIASLMARAVEESNNLARGLDPVAEVPEGLMNALTQLADSMDKLFGTDSACDFPSPVLVRNHTTATELFRIAQEATNNAIKHGRPGTIRIGLTEESGQIILTVISDGVPFPKLNNETGMGLKTMAYRAERISATLTVAPGAEGGTIMRCALANTPEPAAHSATQPVAKATTR